MCKTRGISGSGKDRFNEELTCNTIHKNHKNLEGHVLCSNEGTVHWADSRLTLPKYVLRIGLLQYLITWSTKMVRVWKILLAGPERAYYNNWLTCKFSVVCLKRSDCNGCQKWEGFVCQQLLPPSPGWVVFHTNPCTFWTFQTIVNISLSFMAFKLSFFFHKRQFGPLNA